MKRCSKCGEEAEDQFEACWNCGTEFSASQPTPHDPQEPTAPALRVPPTGAPAVADPYQTGSRGERLLTEYLNSRGRTVARSDHKTFDLVVDGVYAEVKSSMKPYAALGFIGLTDNQFAALNAGQPFMLYLVCNMRDPDNLEVREIPSDRLRAHAPKKECTYYWYRSDLDAMVGGV